MYGQEPYRKRISSWLPMTLYSSSRSLESVKRADDSFSFLFYQPRYCAHALEATVTLTFNARCIACLHDVRTRTEEPIPLVDVRSANTRVSGSLAPYSRKLLIPRPWSSGRFRLESSCEELGGLFAPRDCPKQYPRPRHPRQF